jgi:Protein of unknown function (DUF2637)
MTGDRWIRRTAIAAVAIVAAVAGWVSYRHALQVVSAHGETGWLAKAYPLTIDGLIVAASMVLLTAARQRVRAHWLAYGALALGITATVGVNIAAGAAFGVAGAVIAAWPAPALVISFELLMIVVRSLAASEIVKSTRQFSDPRTTDALVTQTASGDAPADALADAHRALAASVAAGSPISQRQMMARFGLTRTAERNLRAEVLAASNGHAPAAEGGEH